MKSLAIYTALRAAVFIVVFGLLWLVFAGRVSVYAVVLLSLLATGLVSLFLFRKQSAEAGTALRGGLDKLKSRYRSARESEDVDDDE